MEQNTVKVIRDAELAAEEIEKKAAKECEVILSNAKAESVSMVKKAVSEEKAWSAAEMESARKKGASLQTQALHEVEQELEQLRQLSDTRRQQAKAQLLAALF